MSTDGDECQDTQGEEQQQGEGRDISSLKPPREDSETAPEGQPQDSEERLPEAEPRAIVEALLFSTGAPLSSGRLAEVSGVGDGRRVRNIVAELNKDYESGGRAFLIEEIGGGFRLLTRPEYAPWLTRLHKKEREDRLSNAALETLAIIAYRQPILRAEIEDVRGVQSDHILRSLIVKKFIRVVGRSEELGRPLLYGTTRTFLDYFGLRSVDELPPVAEFQQQVRPSASGGGAEGASDESVAEGEGAAGQAAEQDAGSGEPPADQSGAPQEQ